MKLLLPPDGPGEALAGLNEVIWHAAPACVTVKAAVWTVMFVVLGLELVFWATLKVTEPLPGEPVWPVMLTPFEGVATTALHGQFAVTLKE
jgi:hypothetical protein